MFIQIDYNFRSMTKIVHSSRSGSFQTPNVHVIQNRMSPRTWSKVSQCVLQSYRARRFPSVVSNFTRAKSTEVNAAIDVTDEVQEALIKGQPIVALETTILTHGMPFPRNLECAGDVEAIIRSEGAIPASIGILDGRIKVGMTHRQLTKLADVTATHPTKTSIRDLPYVIAGHLHGGTTVSSTAFIANTVGISVFVTGGIGGVHRNAAKTYDVSSDLRELGRSNLLVVSSGVKSILDVPKTLEYLETEGVLVSAYGTDDFPCFYASKSTAKATVKVSSPREAAELLDASRSLNLNRAILVAVPIPHEYSLDRDDMEALIERSLTEAERLGIDGKEMTPFLLAKIAEISGGRSLESNVALIKNNAKIGAEIAVEYAKMPRRLRGGYARKEEKTDGCSQPPVIIGGTVMDCCSKIMENDIQITGKTYNGTLEFIPGGVGRNLWAAMSRIGGRNIPFITAIGTDPNGHFLRQSFPKDVLDYVVETGKYPTAQLYVILDGNGEFRFGFGDTSITNIITPQLIEKHEEVIARAPLVIMDGNLTVDTINYVFKVAKKHHKPVFFEPTDLRVIYRLFQTNEWKNNLHFITPNQVELHEIAKGLSITTNFNPTQPDDFDIPEIAKIAAKIAEHITVVIVTLGSSGVLIASRFAPNEKMFDKCKFNGQGSLDKIVARYYPVRRVVKQVVNVSGAGDCWASGFFTGLLAGRSEANSVWIGFTAAERALNSKMPVPERFKSLDNISAAINAECQVILYEE